MKTKPDSLRHSLFDTAALDKIRDLATASRVCFFGTLGAEFPLHVRPMGLQAVDASGDLWFLSGRTSDKNRHIEADPRVQLLFANPSGAQYLALQGTAVIHHEPGLKEKHWTPLAGAWFTGVDDPDLTVIQVRIVDGHYWDTEHGKAIALLEIALKAVSGRPPAEGVQGRLRP